MSSLSEEQRDALLGLARQAVSEAVLHHELPREIPGHSIFGEQHDVFVTLHVRGLLRGCIGVVETHEKLGDAVVRCAVSAALHDRRFSPVQPADLAEMDIEISLLSIPDPIRADQIEIGRHGLLIVFGSQRGLLLPQVAIAHRLNQEQFLQETCRKAGLNRDAWRDSEAKILGFTCEVFSERQMLQRESHLT